MRTLVATRTAELDARLFRAPPSEGSEYHAVVMADHQDLRGLHLALHPILEGLEMSIVDEYEEVQTRTGTRRPTKRFNVSRLVTGRKENATTPALSEVAFRSWDEVDCISRVRDLTLDGCNKIFRAKGTEGGAVTVEDFLKGFIDSLGDVCTACLSENRSRRLSCFTHCRFSRRTSVVRFESPYWTER